MDTQKLLLDLQSHWSPPKGLELTRPRAIKKTIAGKICFILVFLKILGALVVVVGTGPKAIQGTRDWKSLQKDGIVQKGQITGLWRENDSSGKYLMRYRFFVAGKAFEKSTRVAFQIWRQQKIGQNIEIRYLPTHPEVNKTSISNMDVFPKWVAIFLPILLLSLAGLVLIPLRIQSWLLQEGRPAPAIVTGYRRNQRKLQGAVKVHAGSSQQNNYYYEFRVLSGSIYKGRSGQQHKLPEIGSTICVLYDPNNPKKNMPYPLSLVKLSHIK